jgi:hypothetical protein
VHLLRVHRHRQSTRQVAAGRQWVDSGYVFTDDHGNPLHPAVVTDLFQRLTREADLPPIRLHDLRHGAATHALTAGVDVKVVQDMLGHSSSTLTRDTYTSVADEAKHAAADAISAFLAGADVTRKPPKPLPKLQLPTAEQLYGTKGASPYARRINLDPRVEPRAGTGWELAADRDRPGTWHILHHGEAVGTIDRQTTSSGANIRGWQATRRGIRVTLAANGVGLYGSRDLAAAAIIHLETATPENTRRLRLA